jgi:hypothetical protein
MQLIRKFVVLLLGLAVVVQGHASVRVMDAGCAMGHAAPAGVPAQPAPAQGMGHDHAQHHDTAHHASDADDSSRASSHGQHCQHGAGCQSAGPAIPTMDIQLATSGRASQAQPAPLRAFHSFTPPLLTRPPARV